jgi:large repetitive protein
MHLSLLLGALAAPAPQQAPVLLSDINATSSGVQNGNPARLVALAGDLWLTATDDPWRFVPTTGQAFQLANSFKASGVAVPVGAGRYVQRLREESSVNQLIVSDGTPAGTEVLLNPGPLGALRSDPFEWAGGVFFFLQQGASGAQLWRTDGTPAGTVLVNSFVAQFTLTADVHYAVLGSKLLIANLSASKLAVLTTPGAAATEIGAGGFFFPDFTYGLAFGNRFCFSGDLPGPGAEPWITDGTAAGTFQLANVDPAFDSNPEFLAADANRVWFSATSDLGRELYVSRGTPATTQLVVDLAPGFKPGLPSKGDVVDPDSLAILLPGGDLLFSGTDDTSFGGLQENFELWRSNGNAAGTTLVATLNPGLPGAKPSGFVEHNGLIYFAATTALQGREVVRTDGTPQGTFLALDLAPGAGSSNPRLWSALGSLWIAANHPTLGRELFRSTGSAVGTTLAYEFAPQTTVSSIALGAFEPLRLGDELLFAAQGTGIGNELFATDGTSAGTRLVADLVPGSVSSNPKELRIAIGNRAYLVANGRMYATDGTAAGTQALTDPALAPNPRNLVRLQDQVLFSAGTGASERLWATDGTPAGTLVLAIVQSNNTGQAKGIKDSAELGGVLYFYGRDANGNQAVWRSDGTPSGTGSYASVPITGLNQPFGFLRDADQLLFFAAPSSPSFWYDLWSLDGTPGGASPLFGVHFSPEAAVRIGGGHVIVPQNGALGELWYTDGTQAGTQVLADFLPGFAVSIPESLVTIGERLYFVAALDSSGASGWWSTDGTPAGTQPVPTNQALGLDSYWGAHDDLGSLEELVYTAYTFGAGLELWRHDPQTGQQTPLTDIAPGAGDARPSRSAELNGRLIFDAFSPVHGRELWTLDLFANGVPSAEASAPGCGFNAPAPRLQLLGDLSSGGSFELLLTEAPPFTTALTLYSLPAPWLDLGGGCSATIDLGTAVVLATQIASLNGNASSNYLLPVNPALAGLALSIQSVVVDPGGPLFGSLGTTNGVDLVFAP